jgi:hypothetical protein
MKSDKAKRCAPMAARPLGVQTECNSQDRTLLEPAMIMSLPASVPTFELRFASLFVPGRALAFPCDAQGHVDLETLTGRARVNYFFARGMVGRDYSQPDIWPNQR